ncbi:MAG: hypothetical protein DDT28_01178 [Dehalococcoidia bacterium]|nr:hypothetical protein [Chloroflexota bacterium]
MLQPSESLTFGLRLDLDYRFAEWLAHLDARLAARRATYMGHLHHQLGIGG